MSEQKEYYIERFDISRIKDIEELFVAVYKKKSAENYFSKKYDTAYTGVSYIGYMAYKEKTPIAFYGVIPCFIQYGNEIILAAQSADTMTHPEYRGKGLFISLAKKCYELCKKNNISFVFGFPNQNSYRGFIKLEFEIPEVMDCFQIKIGKSFLKKILAKIDTKRDSRVLKKYIIDEKGLENSVIRDGFFGLHRDNKYFDYKTYSKSYVLKIKESKVWISIKGALWIGDMICAKNNFMDTINSIKKIAFKLGVSAIYFHVSKETFLHKSFSEKFTNLPSFPVIFLNFTDYIDIKKIKFTFADVDIF
jgi:hypothetical protein